MSEKTLSKVRNFIKTAKPPHVAPPRISAQTSAASPTSGSDAAAGTGAADADTRSVTTEAAKKTKVWHPQQEKLLKQWAEIATSFRWMHHRAHLRYSTMHFWFTLPVIVMSSITGTANFAQGTFPSEYDAYIPLIIGAVNLIAGVITTIASYLRVSELSEGNRVASIMFGKLSRNIRVELLLPISERTMDGADFISMCRSELDRLTEQTPDIPSAIERRFLREFEELLSGGNFYPPELTNLHPVEIYSGDVERKQQQLATVVADAAAAFKLAVKKGGGGKEDVESEDTNLPPVPEVALKTPQVVSALTAAAAKTQRAQELDVLSTMQSVTSRLRTKAAGVRKQAMAGVADAAMELDKKAIELVPVNSVPAMAAAAAREMKDVLSQSVPIPDPSQAKEVVIDVADAFFEDAAAEQPSGAPAQIDPV